MKFEKIDITKENINPFQRIGQDWMLISAEREGKVNTMTASWGMMGVFWGKECRNCWDTSTALYKRICRCRRILHVNIF